MNTLFWEMIIHTLAYFSIGLLDFVILIYSSSLHIWDSRPQSVLWNANIFFFLACHLFFDLVYCCFGLFLSVCHVELFFFLELNLSNISLIGLDFVSWFLKRLPCYGVIKEFSHDFFWYIYCFIFYIKILDPFEIYPGVRYGSNSFLIGWTFLYWEKNNL